MNTNIYQHNKIMIIKFAMTIFYVRTLKNTNIRACLCGRTDKIYNF